MGPVSLIVLAVAAIAFSAGGIMIGKLMVKGSKNPQKGEPYECGIPTKTTPWNQFNIGYYLFRIVVPDLRRRVDLHVSMGCSSEKDRDCSPGRDCDLHFHIIHGAFYMPIKKEH